eukprot:c28485_g1_i2 orf=183-2384(+)
MERESYGVSKYSRKQFVCVPDENWRADAERKQLLCLQDEQRRRGGERPLSGMKRGKWDVPSVFGWRRFLHFLLGIVLLCVVCISFQVPKVLVSAFGNDGSSSEDITKASVESVGRSNLKNGGFLIDQSTLRRHLEDVLNSRLSENQSTTASRGPSNLPRKSELRRGRLYGRITNQIREARQNALERSGLQRLADDAWSGGLRAWREMQNSSWSANRTNLSTGLQKSCPQSLFKSKEKIQETGNIMMLPCGLMRGSSITVIGKPRHPRPELVEYNTRMGRVKESTLVSQFFLELQGLIVVGDEDPPRVLHVNPRLKGDWAGHPVIELNTCYRGQWGRAQRCVGLASEDDDDDGTVDGLSKCENWNLDDEEGPKASMTTWWFDKLIGHAGSLTMDRQYPFLEHRMFVMTVRAGMEGYHITVDGRHIASFPYRTGFSLEDATRLSINGDIDLHSVVATSLPPSHPNVSPEKLLEISNRWKAPPLPEGQVELFIGVLSAASHFAERMVVRKTWMQSSLITSSNVVARFFVALHSSKEVNAQLLKEAAFYEDMVIVPFLDRYELLVLKTVAICEYGVRNISAKYIMKCDDDTFVRVESVLYEVKATHHEHGLYMGNMNLYHKPLRLGKWAVTYAEWPEEDYPPYANGAGYIITNDIANFIVSQHANHTLRLFKMEDVSMGLWVVQFNTSYNIYYHHNWKFCQVGCVADYFIAHYQSPRQMLCMWENLQQGKPQCCNNR